MSKMYGCLPSEIIGIEDGYTSFCFNEACCYIMTKLQNEEKPHYIEQEQTQTKHYSSFKDFYKHMEG